MVSNDCFQPIDSINNRGNSGRDVVFVTGLLQLGCQQQFAGLCPFLPDKLAGLATFLNSQHLAIFAALTELKKDTGKTLLNFCPATGKNTCQLKHALPEDVILLSELVTDTVERIVSLKILNACLPYIAITLQPMLDSRKISIGGNRRAATSTTEP